MQEIDPYFMKIVATIISGGIIWLATSVTSLNKNLAELTVEVRIIKERLGAIDLLCKTNDSRINAIEKECVRQHGGN